MDYLRLEGEVPSLRRPTMVAAFRGWNDAGEAASLAVRHLVDTWSAQEFASIDPEEFFDFTVARPTIRITEEGQRDLQWPANRFFYHRREDAEEDVILFLGTEPHLRWRAFTEAVYGVYSRMEGARMVTLGALVAATTHRRPPPVTGFATEESLRSRLEGQAITRSRYEGPTGIVGALHDVWRRAEKPAASLWVGLPPYLGGAMNPRGAQGLLEMLDRLFAFAPDLSKLVEASRNFEQQIEDVLAGNEEMRHYLGEMEKRIEAGESAADGPELPPAREVIGDLEEFLRQQLKD